jgi:cell division protein FtsL
MYQGSAAYSLYGAERRHPQEVERHAPFEVVRGDGLDAQVRQGVSRDFLARFSVAMAVIAVFVVLGFCRVSLTTATVTQLQKTASLKEDIVSAQVTNNELQVERSVLSSSSRIDRIATQNYGMVYPTSSDSIRIDDAQGAPGAASLQTPIQAMDDPEASADDAQPANAIDHRLSVS